MATYNEEFNHYRIFLENIAKSVNPQSDSDVIKAQHLRNRTICHSDAEGEVIYWILKFLDDKKCPTKLIAPIVRNVLVEVKNDPRYKDPNGDANYDLRGLATTILESFCIRLLDNVELNKILATATSHSAQQQQQLNDDLLPIPIRTVGIALNKRRKMEDRNICVDEFHKVYDIKDAQKSSFYGVFDGHNGYPAAQYAASQLPLNLSLDAFASSNPINALYRTFKYTDEKFISKKGTSGTTASCVLYRPEEGRLFIAWVGDSKALLAKQHGKIMQLVTPHRPELESENNRIRDLGGSVHYFQGSLRVNGSLNVTRSIGDISMKMLLISCPDCVLVELDKQEEFLVLATDGLWDYASDADVAKTVYDCIKEDCENLDQIPSRLIKLAQDGNSADNISIVVLFFKHPSQIAKNCDNLTIMDSEFDNIKEVGYYNSRTFYPSDENTTSNSHAIDAKQLRWTPNDNLNNIINEEVKQTTTTTTVTTTTTNNGQFDDNLLYSSDNIDLNQKLSPQSGDDNNLHHASTVENNGEELVAAGYDNKGEISTEFDNDQHKILEKNQPHHQQLGDTDADYGPETCVDVTDDVVMMTENSADTNNLLEQSTLSHSKDTLPSSDNCNPFDNKNTLDMEDGNEYQLGSGCVDAQIQLDDANKSTPLLSPEVEDLPLSCEGGLQYTNEGFQQSPMDEIPVVFQSQAHSEFEDEFMQSNGHLSPLKVDFTQKTEEEQQQQHHIGNLEKIGDVEEEKLVKGEEFNERMEEDIPQQQENPNFDVDLLGNLVEHPFLPQKENSFENVCNDENDFRLKDEEEIPEKHVEVLEPKSEVFDFNQRDELQQTLHNLEDDVLEEKPILTGSFTEKQVTEINFDDLSMQPEEEKISEFADEKQDREEFSEKEDKAEKEEKIALSPIENKPAKCMHFDEDYVESQVEANKELWKAIEEMESEPKLDEVEPHHIQGSSEMLVCDEDEGISENMKLVEEHYEQEVMHSEHPVAEQLEEPLYNEKVDEQLEYVEKVYEKEEERHEDEEKLPEEHQKPIEEELQLSDREEKRHEFKDELLQEPVKPQVEQMLHDFAEEHMEKDKQDLADKELDKQIEQIDKVEHYDIDENVSFETEKREHERHLNEIEMMSQQFDRFEMEDQADERLNPQPLGSDEQSEPIESSEQDRLHTPQPEIESPLELQSELQPTPEQIQLNDTEEQIFSHYEEPADNKMQSEEEPNPVVDDMIAQPEKQCFEEPEKITEEATNDLVLKEEQSLAADEPAVEEIKNNMAAEDSFEETEKHIAECTEKELERIEAQVLDPEELFLKKSVVQLNNPFQAYELDPENLVEVVEETIVKEKVPIKTTPLPVSTQEPSAVPPTHESCDESEDDEWKYMKEGQGEKQLLGLQSDTVVEEELQQQLQEAAAFTVHTAEKLQQSEPAFNEPIVAAVDLDSIKNTFDTLTQNISDLAESAAEVSESAVEQIGDTLESINISQSSTQEKLDNLEDEDLLSEMNSKLNPEAKEFVPTFSSPGPTDMSNGLSGAPPSAIPQHFKDEVLAQSPRKGRESDMEDIKIPAENEFDLEIAHKPHGLPGDEAIIEQAENGGQYQEMNWKEAMHGSEKEEEPMVDSPVTEESLEVVDNAHQTTHPICDFSAPVDLDNAGMKESIYIENNTSAQSNEEDVLNTVQLLPEEENDSKDNSFEVLCKEEVTGSAVEEAQIKDAVTMEEVQEILNLEIEKKLEEMNDVEIQQKMEQLLLSHDQEITKDIQLETEQVPINGVEMSPTTPEVALIPTEVAVEPVVEQPQEPSAPVELSTSPVPVADEAIDALTIGAAAAVAVAATTAAVKKVEAEKNQKNLSKTSSATKSKVPDTKKPAAGTTTKSSTVSSVAAKRPLSDKPKPATASSLATKKTVGSTTSAAPRPRPAPASGATKMVTEKKTTTTTTTSTAKSRIDTRPPLTARKPLTSSAVKTSLSKPTDDAKSGSTTLKSSVSKSTVGSKPSVGSTRPTSAISKPRPTTASSVATTNGTGATKTPASKPTPLAPKSATNLKASMTSPRGTLTSSLRKTEAIKIMVIPDGTLFRLVPVNDEDKVKKPKSPTKTTSTTITSRVSTTNGTKPTTTTRTTTTKTTSSTVQPAAARSTTTTTTTTRRPLAVGGTTSTGGPTTPTPKTNNLVPRKSTPLKKTTSTPPVRKSLGSKLNASATKPTKDTTTPRPVTIPSHITNNHSAAAAAAAAAASTEALKDIATLEPTPLVDGEPKLNGITSPDDVPSPIAPAASHPLEMEIA